MKDFNPAQTLIHRKKESSVSPLILFVNRRVLQRGLKKLQVDSKFMKNEKECRELADGKRAEDIKISDRKNTQVFDSMTEMFQVIELIYDEDGNAIDYCYLQVNPAFEKLVNRSKQELIGKRAKELFSVVEDHWIKTYERVEKTGNSEKCENYGAELDKYYSINAWRVHDKKVAIMFTDITEVKRKEIKLTAALERAEDSDKLRGAFLSNMSHEIRTPLNAILGFSSLLKKQHLPSDKKEMYLDLIESSGKSLLTLIGDILEVSKIEANQLRINLHSINLNELLDDLYNQFSLQCKDSNNFLIETNALPDNSSFIITDDVRLIQVLSNLIGNALKFTKGGKIEFGYTVEGTFLQFFVKDTGIGIAPINHTSIFERFGQAENEYKTARLGTGLGLAIVKGIVELLKGDIWVESEVNLGAAFYFRLPYNQGEPILDPKKLGGKPSFDAGNEATILVAEDELIDLLLLEATLEDYPYKIIHAISGQDAVDTVSNDDSIDLVLMDIKMPIVDGFEAVREIRKTNSSIPIIALSGVCNG